MSILATINSFLSAATQAMKAFPLWLAWRQGEQIEKLTDEIIEFKGRSLPGERAKLDRLQVRLANAREQYEALLSIVNSPEGGDKGSDNPR